LHDGEASQNWTEVAMAGTSEFLPATINWTLVKTKVDLEFDHAGGALEAIKGRTMVSL